MQHKNFISGAEGISVEGGGLGLFHNLSFSEACSDSSI